MQKTNQKEFRVEKVIKRKGDVKWKGYNNSFNSWIGKKDILEMSKYFPEPKSFGLRAKVELDLSNYATNTDLKNATGIDTSDLINLKSKADKLDVDKLVPVPVDLSKLSDIVKKMYIMLR